MPHSSSILTSWLSEPPEALVIGDGPYVRALTLVLRGTSVIPEDLLAGFDKPEGGIPLVLASLARAVFVAGASQSATDILGWHAALWRWIAELSPEGEQHEVSILFVLPSSLGDSIAESLALGLALDLFDPSLGHGLARMGNSLESLCRAVSTIRPCDLPPLRARQAGNARHKLIRQLIEAKSPNELVEAARDVNGGFRGQEYHLDLFCRPPGHRNGNALRQWLREAVSEGIHSEKFDSVKSSLATWLRDG